jgi:hypothetical protein
MGRTRRARWGMVRTSVHGRSLMAATAFAVAIGAASVAGCSDEGGSGVASVSDRPVPRPLVRLEASSEDIIDQVPKARWTRISGDVVVMRRAWRRYAEAARSLDAGLARRLDRALDRLEPAATAQSPGATVQAANDVSAPVVELFARYASGHPVQVGRLDVIGRQIVIEAARGDFPAARRQIAAARAQWRSVKTSVIDHGGRAVAKRTDATFALLQEAAVAGDAAAATKAANALLELVDGMERTYRRS